METDVQARDPGRHPELLHDRATCTCVRCTGFQKGHKVNVGSKVNVGKPRDDLVKHGFQRSPLVLRPQAEAIAEIIRPLLPVPHPSFDGSLQSYCIILARLQLAHDYLEKMQEKKDDGTFDAETDVETESVEIRLLRLMNNGLKYAVSLGLTPESAVKIGRDAQMGNFAAQAALTLESAQQVSVAGLEKMKVAMREALAEASDTVDG